MRDMFNLLMRMIRLHKRSSRHLQMKNSWVLLPCTPPHGTECLDLATHSCENQKRNSGRKPSVHAAPNSGVIKDWPESRGYVVSPSSPSFPEDQSAAACSMPGCRKCWPSWRPISSSKGIRPVSFERSLMEKHRPTCCEWNNCPLS